MHDLRLAFRALRATPIVSIAAVLSLALGIGANTAIFSILNSLLLKPLPVRDPQRLVAVGSDQSDNDINFAYPVWKEIRDRGVLGNAFAWTTDGVTIADEAGATTPLQAIWASGRLFDTLGVTAIAGRTFGDADDRPGGGRDGPVAVLSYGLWQRRLGGAADAIGRTLLIDRVPFTIVGVAPASFFGLNVGNSFDVILPLETERLIGRRPPRLESKGWTWLHIMARLSPSSTAETATAALRNAQPQIRQATMPDYGRADLRDAHLRTPWRARPAATGSSGLRSRYGPALFALLAIVALVLLVASANIANLQLARTAARRYEFSVRAALGASRLRIARQLLAESLLLSAIGAALGFALAHWGSRLIVQQLSSWAYTAFLDLSPDWRVLGVTAAVTVATAILFGTAPALRAARVDPIEALKQQTRVGDTRGGLGGALVIVQIAVSLVLVVAAGLFLRSFSALAYRDLGFERDRVVVALVNVQRSTILPGGHVALYDRVREAVAAVPGVESVAASMATPLGQLGNVRFTPSIEVPGSRALPGGEQVRHLMNPVSPDWFRTFGTRLEAGREFDARDRAGAQPVAIVNQAFARRYFDGANPLDRTIVQLADSGDRRLLDIVGVAADAAFVSVRDAPEPTIYTPLAQGVEDEQLAALATVSISVRAAHGSPARLTRGIAAAIAAVDRDASFSFLTVNRLLDYFYIRERLLALLSGFFGALALLLAALGLYGVTADAVARRRREIGIRIALGATAGRVMRLVLGRVACLVAAGLVGGAIVSFWAGRAVSTLLFGIHPRDPATYAAAVAVLTIVSVAAAWFPARRATSVDPMMTLRSE